MLSLLAQGSRIGAHPSAKPGGEAVSPKFTPVDLSPYFNVSPRDFGPREKAKEIGGGSARDGLIRVPTGKETLQGIPFWLGPEGLERKSWIGLSTTPKSWGERSVEIPLGKRARFVCLATFCDWDENETPPPGKDIMEKVGQCLAQAELIYEDGSKTSLPLRRRFEVNSPRVIWGHVSFNAVEDRKFGSSELTVPLPSHRLGFPPDGS